MRLNIFQLLFVLSILWVLGVTIACASAGEASPPVMDSCAYDPTMDWVACDDGSLWVVEESGHVHHFGYMED